MTLGDGSRPVLNGFERDVFALVARYHAGAAESKYSEGPYGAEIRRKLQTAYADVHPDEPMTEIASGRLYPALESLREAGLVECVPISDGREGMEAYRLTDDGVQFAHRRSTTFSLP